MRSFAVSFGLVSLFTIFGCGATNNSAGPGGGDGGSNGTTSAEGGKSTGTSNSGGGGASAGGAGQGGSGNAGGQGGGGCVSGAADCNANPADGCETNLLADVNNCGACGVVCEGGGGVPPTCAAGICKLDCPSGTGNCNMNLSDGCETNVNQDAQNCGGCGLNCMGSPCVEGTCACAAETTTANFAPLDLFIMLDQSGSMDDTVAGGGTRWQAVTAALKGFFSDPANSALGVGLQYFPIGSGTTCNPICTTNADCGAFGPCFIFVCLGCADTGGDSCNAADYATAAVEIAPLSSAQVTALSTSINSHSPTTNTPTGPALQGAVNHAKAWAMTHPSHNVVVVMATDGEPTECTPSDIPGISAIASAGVNGSPSIKTFVIGVGASLANLNSIAQAGGTGSAFLVDNGNIAQQFKAALDQIQDSVLGCEYLIPQPAMGMLDYDKVNVQYTPGNGGAVQVLLNVADAASCDPVTGGWYYDSNSNPTKIVICPQACGQIENDPNGSVEVLLGCATEHI